MSRSGTPAVLMETVVLIAFTLAGSSTPALVTGLVERRRQAYEAN